MATTKKSTWVIAGIFAFVVVSCIASQNSTPGTTAPSSGSKLQPVAAGAVDADSAALRWDYETTDDKMTGKPRQRASISSKNSLDLAFPYQGPNYGLIHVRQKSGESPDVLVHVSKGQIICDISDGCSVPVRFDEAQPVSFHALTPDDHSSTTLFLQSESKFLALAKKAKVIRVQLTMYQAGNQILEFEPPEPLKWPMSPAPKNGSK